MIRARHSEYPARSGDPSPILVLKGQSAYEVLRIFADQLASAFQGAGREVEVVDLLAHDASTRLVRALSRPCDFVFAFNGAGCDVKLSGNRGLYEALGVRSLRRSSTIRSITWLAGASPA
jgi:hypothetical protein